MELGQSLECRLQKSRILREERQYQGTDFQSDQRPALQSSWWSDMGELEGCHIPCSCRQSSEDHGLPFPSQGIQLSRKD